MLSLGCWKVVASFSWEQRIYWSISLWSRWCQNLSNWFHSTETERWRSSEVVGKDLKQKRKVRVRVRVRGLWCNVAARHCSTLLSQKSKLKVSVYDLPTQQHLFTSWTARTRENLRGSWTSAEFIQFNWDQITQCPFFLNSQHGGGEHLNIMENMNWNRGGRLQLLWQQCESLTRGGHSKKMSERQGERRSRFLVHSSGLYEKREEYGGREGDKTRGGGNFTTVKITSDTSFSHKTVN